MRIRALAFGFVLSLSTVALADNKAESDKLFGEGLHLFAQKDFAHARMKFAEAYSKYPSPNSLLNLARSEQLSGECLDAITHYRAYIALPENPRISSFDRGSATIKLNASKSRRPAARRSPSTASRRCGPPASRST